MLGKNRVTVTPMHMPSVPFTLMKSFAMVPVDFVEPSRTLHLAFSRGIDYSVLYAIEQMAGCRTAACIASASTVHQHLELLCQPGRESELHFDAAVDVAEFAHILASYSDRTGPSQIRIAGCGQHLWGRLFRPGQSPLDLFHGPA